MVNADVFNAIMSSLDDTEKAKIKEMNSSPYLKEEENNSIFNSSIEAKSPEVSENQESLQSNNLNVSEKPHCVQNDDDDLMSKILLKLENLSNSADIRGIIKFNPCKHTSATATPFSAALASGGAVNKKSF